jgi:hypothetical protein
VTVRGKNMNKRITITVELGKVIDDDAHDMADFLEDLGWTIKEFLHERTEGFRDWNHSALTGMTNQKEFLWANEVLMAFEKARDEVSISVEDVEYADVED